MMLLAQRFALLIILMASTLSTVVCAADAERRYTPSQIIRMMEVAKKRDKADQFTTNVPQACRKIFGKYWRVEEQMRIEDCWVDAYRNERAVVVKVQYDCGGDSCTVDGLAVTEKGARVFLEDEPGNTEFDNQLNNLYIDSFSECYGGGSDCVSSTSIRIDRIRLATGKRQAWAKCFSASASEDGAWVYCRDFSANVWRFADSSRKLELVWRNNKRKQGVYSVPYANIYPAQVWFSVGAINFTVNGVDDTGDYTHTYTCAINPQDQVLPLKSDSCSVKTVKH